MTVNTLITLKSRYSDNAWKEKSKENVNDTMFI